jgi:hypothetical protein
MQLENLKRWKTVVKLPNPLQSQEIGASSKSRPQDLPSEGAVLPRLRLGRPPPGSSAAGRAAAAPRRSSGGPPARARRRTPGSCTAQHSTPAAYSDAVSANKRARARKHLRVLKGGPSVTTSRPATGGTCRCYRGAPLRSALHSSSSESGGGGFSGLRAPGKQTATRL